ncbi:hypothetical protein CTRI78_v005323 [Colletotrichum trifolii]|uniref:Uncharacterized protein n=1 Tax=Colletotrichum trifolii TaxID=5466 RepID=A0A4V3HWA0_COLTR|nr:hypothetical protein CTRI78_v005323 [Colletotrichum trifolii]
MGKSILGKLISTVTVLLEVLAVGVNNLPTHGSEEDDLAGVGGNMQDHYVVGTVGKASTEPLLLKQCTFLEMNGIAGGQHPCYDKWHDGIGGLFKGGYTTNGIGFGYFRNS